MRKYIATFILFFFSIGLLQAQPTVDGDLSDTDYVTMATKQNSNASFGSNIDVIEIVYYADDGNQTLFFGIKGKLDTGTDNAIGFWWNFSNQTGASSGDELGFDGAGHYMDGESGGTNDNFKADFEVDYMFAMNPGNGSTSVFYDAASKIGGNTSNFLGQSDQSGNQSTNSNSDGTLFTKDAITFAFNNGGSANQGFEMSIPYSELGITSLETFEAFAFIVSNSGFFSNVTVPGDLTGTDQPGFNADFTLADVNGDGSTDAGPFNSGPQTVGGENLTGSEGFRLLSIPTSNTTFADLLDPLWTQGVPSADAPNNGDPNVMVWDNTSSGADASNFTAVGDLTNIPNPGTGFLTFVFSDDDFDGTPDGFPKTLSLSGSENSGSFDPNINQNPNGFTLLGNPFASTVDFDDFTFSTGDFTGVAYAWDPNDNTGDDTDPNNPGGSWKTWNGNTGDLTDGLIAPFQGFFIQNTSSVSATPSVVIENADKTTGGTFLGKNNDQEPLAVRMQIEGNDLANSTWLSFTENGSLSERVRGDALKLESLSDTFVQLGTTKPGLETLLDINHLPLALEETVEVPVDINSTVSGGFTLKATDFRIPEGMSLTFNNLATGESTPMGPDFETTIEVTADQQSKASAEALVSAPEKLRQTTSSAAYSITIAPDVITSVDDGGLDVPNKVELQQNFPNPFNPSTTIQYALPAQSQVNLTVYDMLGQRVATLLSGQVQSAGSHSVNFDASNLSSGVYIYRLQAGSQSITRKMILLK